jgi:hypothetical protein
MEALRPKDLIVITTSDENPILNLIEQDVHVGLNLSKMVGEDVESAFVAFQVYSDKTKPWYDIEKAKKGWETFIKKMGFTPNDLLEELDQAQIKHNIK